MKPPKQPAMTIVCPACEASYEVPDAVLVARRPVRCARCGKDWVPGEAEAAAASVAPEQDDPAPPRESHAVAESEMEPAPPTPEPVVPDAIEPEAWHRAAEPLPPAIDDAVDEIAITPAPPRPALKVSAAPALRQPRLAWGASFLVLAGALSAGLMFPAPVMKAWPPSTRLYAAIGIYAGPK